jgi:FkbM family methyltransferase
MEEPILITGLPEPLETNAVYVRALNLPEGGVVIDAGAYCGASSIMFSDLVGPSGTVVSIEPDPRNFEALERNTRDRGNILRFKGALWAEDVELSFAAEANMGSAVGEGRPGAEVVSVKGYSPTELVQSLSLTRLDGIKLDIEGSEVEVIPALEPIVREFSPRLIFELHDVGRHAVKNIFAAIDLFGYEVEQIQQSEMERFHLYSAWRREPRVPG